MSDYDNVLEGLQVPPGLTEMLARCSAGLGEETTVNLRKKLLALFEKANLDCAARVFVYLLATNCRDRRRLLSVHRAMPQSLRDHPGMVAAVGFIRDFCCQGQREQSASQGLRFALPRVPETEPGLCCLLWRNYNRTRTIEEFLKIPISAQIRLPDVLQKRSKELQEMLWDTPKRRAADNSSWGVFDPRISYEERAYNTRVKDRFKLFITTEEGGLDLLEPQDGPDALYKVEEIERWLNPVMAPDGGVDLTLNTN